MDRYSVMIVDDEEEVRQAIVKRLNWEELGFYVIEEAENGEEALEKAQRLTPDVILTDIHMPFMDGLTFIQKLRKKITGTKVVIFSGYDEFEYAKEAIKLEAQEYILKPIHAEELKELFIRLRKTIEEERDQKRNVERLERYYVESEPFLKEQFFTALLEGRLREEEIKYYLNMYQMNMNASYYAVGIVKGEKAEELHSHLLNVSIKQIVDENLEKEFTFKSINYLDSIVIIVLLNQEEEINDFIHTIDQACNIAHRILEIHTMAGIGKVRKSIQNLHHSYIEANAALDYKLLVKPNQAIYIHDMEPLSETRFIINEIDIQQIIKAIKVGTMEELEETVINIVQQMTAQGVSLLQLQNSMMEVFVELLRLARVYELEAAELEGLNKSFITLMQQVHSQESVVEWLLHICVQLRSKIRLERKDNTRLLIDKAKEYIEINFADTELSVEKLCNHLGLSAAYFSTVFKRETGLSFVTYLTDRRMEKALELLNTTDEKAYIISELVGYMEPNYFSYVFKKQFGVSPSKYRAQKEVGILK